MKNENCNDWKSRLSEYADGTLDLRRSLNVQDHIANCTACARIVRDFESTAALLHTLPARPLSVNFEANLARRLSEAQQRPQKAYWLTEIIARLNPRVLRPALALGTAAIALGGVVFLTHPPPIAQTSATGQTLQSLDQGLVSQCVEQHQSYVAAQPLADWSAQNLAGHYDKTNASDTLRNASVPSADSL